MKTTGAMCVKCGKEATEGSYKHPYCKKCFKEEFKNYEEYAEFMRRTH